MDAQLVDWGFLAGLLGLATLLWRMMTAQTKNLDRRFGKQDRDLDRRFGKQDKELAGLRSDMGALRSDVGELKTDMAVVQNDLGHVKDGLGQLRDDFGRLQNRCERMDTNLLQIMRDVGRLEGEQRSASSRERIGAGSS
ncbi:hypothetical protein [Candidatus Spongiisocius sp.]|uniref:hypothetical protein n=1 Tax=Candidatus Spongiisocius sp. TaxID=3101273 RepID=UPI003B59574B